MRWWRMSDQIKLFVPQWFYDEMVAKGLNVSDVIVNKPITIERVVKAWEDFKPKVPLTYFVAARKAARQK